MKRWSSIVVALGITLARQPPHSTRRNSATWRSSVTTTFRPEAPTSPRFTVRGTAGSPTSVITAA